MRAIWPQHVVFFLFLLYAFLYIKLITCRILLILSLSPTCCLPLNPPGVSPVLCETEIFRSHVTCRYDTTENLPCCCNTWHHRVTEPHTSLSLSLSLSLRPFPAQESLLHTSNFLSFFSYSRLSLSNLPKILTSLFSPFFFLRRSGKRNVLARRQQIRLRIPLAWWTNMAQIKVVGFGFCFFLKVHLKPLPPPTRFPHTEPIRGGGGYSRSNAVIRWIIFILQCLWLQWMQFKK